MNLIGVAFKRISTIRNSTYLNQPVEWNNWCQYNGEIFNDGHNSVCYPVGKPFGIVQFCTRFDGMYGHIGRIYNADNITQQLGSIAKDQI